MPVLTESINDSCNKKQMKKSYSSSTITNLKNHNHTTINCNNHSHSISSNLTNGQQKTQVNKQSSKCPHVVLIGNICIEDLDIQNIYLRQQLKTRESISEDEKEEVDKEPESNNKQIALIEKTSEEIKEEIVIQCEDCDKYLNLWMCLREDCMYVGCGRDDHSNKHIDLHAHKMWHPLSINLTTKCVWCDLCEQRINLQENDPSFQFRSRENKDQEQNLNYQQQQLDDTVDDYKLLIYLDQDLTNNSQYTTSDPDEFLNRLDLIKNGQFGLDNMGNTCYMNAALQALSNCFAFTSYFLELSANVNLRVKLQAQDMQRPSSFNIFLNNANSFQSISINYLNLMRQLWLNVVQTKKLGSINPSDLVHTIKLINPMFRGYQQHDSQEFLIYLMDQLHEELKRPVLIENNDTLVSHEEKEIKEEAKKSDNISNDLDSGVFSMKSKNDDDISSTKSLVENNKKTLTNGLFHNQNGKDHDNEIEINENDDNESIESYETCGEDENVIVNENDKYNHKSISTSSSDKLHFSDADETLPSSNNDQNHYEIAQLNKKNKNKKKKKLKEKKNDEEKKKPTYTSIVSELFDGKIISQVQCLECNHLSTTTETFQHLSLPIPSKEYLQALHNKIMHQQQQDPTSNNNTNNYNKEAAVPYQSWLSWMMSFMKGYIYTTNIELTECLTAFFSDDDLKGDNMYSCEKCKKLTNGVKYSKILNLPETLIIHLKRFRHDSMFSTGKLNSYVSFPLDNLNMQPFVHKECKNEITQYDLCSLICHHGSANGGHYTAFARNSLNEEWYEYDDSYCRQIESFTVQNAQAYVLFYKKKNFKTETFRDTLRESYMNKTSILNDQSLLEPYYISKQWLHKLKYFAEPGPIDNSDFLCKHNFVQPQLWKSISNLTVACTTDTWMCLVKEFGLKYNDNQEFDESDNDVNNYSIDDDENEEEIDETFTNICNYLQPCRQCLLEDEKMKQRQVFEKTEFLRLREQQQPSSKIFYAISSVWFKQWEQFVQFPFCPMKHQVPGKINNLPICVQPKQDKNNNNSKNKNKNNNKNITYQLNKNSNFYRISEEMWKFLHGIYGGGPQLIVANSSSNLNSLNSNSNSRIKRISTSSTSSIT